MQYKEVALSKYVTSIQWVSQRRSVRDLFESEVHPELSSSSIRLVISVSRHSDSQLRCLLPSQRPGGAGRYGGGGGFYGMSFGPLICHLH